MTAILAREPGIARHRLDLHDAVVDFRHFLREQQRHELGPRARQENLRSPLLAAHVVDVGADAVAEAHVLARDHLVAADDALGAAQIDDDVAVFDALDRAVDDLAHAVLVLVVMALALGLAHLLHDDLLGVLRRHAAEIQRRQRLGDHVADLGIGVAPLGVGERDLGGVVLDLLDHLQHAGELGLAGLGVDLAADVVLGAVARFRRLLDRVLHGLDDDLAVDRLLARHSVGDLQQLQPVCAYACLRHTLAPSMSNLIRGVSGRGICILRLLRAPERFANKLVRQNQPRLGDDADRQPHLRAALVRRSPRGEPRSRRGPE